MTLLGLGELFRKFGSEIAVDVSAKIASVREAALAEKRMRTDAEAVVVLAAPVAEIVLRFLTAAREVADLVL